MSTHWTNRDGVAIAWSDLDDRHLWNIVRMLTRDARSLARAQRLSNEKIRQLIRAREELLSDEYISRREVAEARYGWRVSAQRKRATLSLAVDEVARRGLLPTVDDLRVAWDRVCGGDGGPNVATDPAKRPWCLVELWVGFRGVPTFTSEWLAAQRQLTPASTEGRGGSPKPLLATAAGVAHEATTQTPATL